LNEKPSPAPEPPGPLKHAFLRYGIRFFVGCYLRVRHENFETLPDPPYLLNFSHPSWVDPFLLASHWPRSHRLFIFGPREEDMGAGWRNRLIAWARVAVPFKPSRSDLIDTTRRAQAVLKEGYVLAIAGEGRLSDREGEIEPLEEGVAYFALRARVPVVPMAIIGTRWIRFGKTVRMRVGPAVELGDRKANREGVASLTAEVQAAIEALLVGVRDEPLPGPFARWFSELFNERPWLTDPDWKSRAWPARGREDEHR